MCRSFAQVWAATQDASQEWPEGYKLLKQKLYHNEKLCVPYLRAVAVLEAHHVWNAHQGSERLQRDIEMSYEFPTMVDLKRTLANIRQSCMVCQACHATNKPSSGPIVMTVIPPRVMASVCLDLFSMPEVG